MTARERASELVVAFRQETDDMPGSDDYDQLVIDIASALADAERGVWERVIDKAQQASNDSASPEWILKWAKAQAEKEG